MIEAVIFDLDGLIFNTEDVFIRATDEFLRPYGLSYEDELRRTMMGQQAHVATAMLKEYYGLKVTAEEIRAGVEREFMRVLPDILCLMPGFADLIQAINKAGIPAAVCTSSSSSYANTLLDEYGYRRSFEFILGGEQVVNGKPAPDCYLMACRQLGYRPASVMVLEDSENGCRAAIDAGTFAVAVPSAHNDGHVYTGAAIIANSLADVAITQALNILE